MFWRNVHTEVNLREDAERVESASMGENMLATRTCACIRRESFGKPLPYNEKLRELAKDEPSHLFLANPASQHTYLYLVEYVQAFSEQYFHKSIADLTVLDWGCGKGHVSFLLRERGALTVSCDHFAEGEQDGDSAFGQGTPIIWRTGIKVDRLSDPVKLPYADRQFDVALSFGVLEHVQKDLGSLKELRRVLRPGGLLFCFNLPYRFSWTQLITRLRGVRYHDRLYTKVQTIGLLQEANFVPLDLWHRQLFPKNNVRYPFYQGFERLDQFIVERTPLRYLATNIEFVAAAEGEAEGAA